MMLDNRLNLSPEVFDTEFECPNCFEPVDSEGQRCRICVGLVCDALMAIVMDGQAKECDRCGEPRDTVNMLCTDCMAELDEDVNENDWEGDTLANPGLCEADFR